MSEYKNFKEMEISLRAGAASGMMVRIEMEPQAALVMADTIKYAREGAQKEVIDSLREIAKGHPREAEIMADIDDAMGAWD